MPCPHCCSAKTTERSDRTTHGYRRFRCRSCGRGFKYRAIDRDGNLVVVYLSETRDQEAAEALFRSAVTVTGTTPDKVTTDKHASYPPALEEVFCDDLECRTSKYLNNHLEQDHRAVKARYQPMRGFQTHTSAFRFCMAYDEVRDFLHPATQRKEHVSAGRRRAIHVQSSPPSAICSPSPDDDSAAKG
ncbi:hypothetical protein SAE02_73440 [Skermanella aerolata]|uniref:DDE domain-containing protein n=1 Tax=Skermanella aerolata TaxID=393310 RepID=A0A512E3D2_9PROT|nr:DDE-type integrase/transposase/recombinase [Skermanella aerolata]KJB90673.1 integrase [Skermanella aerolata KACC 11604]GEO43196.1 hypothetical protein SAE02_73440 [Skermanella aerolata]